MNLTSRKTRRCCTVIVLFLLLQPVLLQGQTTDGSASLLQTVVNDLSVSGLDGVAFFTAPFHFDQDDVITASLLCGTTGLIITADGNVRSFWRRNQSAGGSSAASTFNYGGEVLYAGTLSGAMYLTGLFTNSDAIRVTGRMMLQSLLYAGVANMAVKFTFGRSRPFRDEGAWKFNWFETRDEKMSLSSGHTTVAFALASVLSDRIDNTVVTIALYGAATSVGLARMYSDRHWASDVFLGAAIGTTAGWFVAARERERSSPSEAIGCIRILPTGNGLMISVGLDSR